MIEQNLSPVANEGQTYIYFAEYNDGSYLYEYDEETNHYNFDSINQVEVKNFGLIGNRLKLFFETENGIFHIGKQQFKIKITKDDDTELSYDDCKKSLITFKTAHTDCSFSRMDKMETVIESFNFGFKTKIDNTYIAILFVITLYGDDLRPFFGVKISDKNNTNYTIELIEISGADETKFSKKEAKTDDGRSIAVELYFN